MLRSPRSRLAAEIAVIALLALAAVYCAPPLDEQTVMMQDTGS